MGSFDQGIPPVCVRLRAPRRGVQGFPVQCGFRRLGGRREPEPEEPEIATIEYNPEMRLRIESTQCIPIRL